MLTLKHVKKDLTFEQLFKIVTKQKVHIKLQGVISNYTVIAVIYIRVSHQSTEKTIYDCYWIELH